jgi:hypothetical protein
VRLRLRALLPGNDPRARRINVPADLENALVDWMWGDESGRSYLAAPPDVVDRWLREIRTLISANPAPDSTEVHGTVLVTRRWETRAPLERLLALSFPGMTTLASDEVLADDSVAAETAPARG